VIAYSEEEASRFRRIYPEPAAASLVGYYSPLQFGTTGLEAAYDDVLSGESTTSPRAWFEREILGRPQSGGSVSLTIDMELQQAAADMLSGSNGAVVLIDVQTGAILAMASAPAIEPNSLVAVNRDETEDAARYWDLLTSDPDLPLIPRATVGLYAPGSTFKTITAAAAIDSGLADPETIYEDDGSLEIDGRILVENNRPDDSIDEWTLREGLMWSLNVVYAQVGLELGADELERYAAGFGFGADLPIDLPTSESQLASNESTLEDPNALADTAFGQGELLVSPLHMALVATAFANEGQIMRPYVAEETSAADGDVIERAEPGVWRSPISAETAGDVQAMMVDAVESGLIQAAQIPGLVVGGKTGTAEVTDQRPHSWFIGFAGDSEPQYAVSVLLENGGRGQGTSLDIGRDMLALAAGSGIAGTDSAPTADVTFKNPQKYAYVRPFSGAFSLSFSAENGTIRYARNGGASHRATSSAAVRTVGHRCPRRAAGRRFGDARQRRGRRRRLAD
jgi:peptidoglycan glycosyltransferase